MCCLGFCVVCFSFVEFVAVLCCSGVSFCVIVFWCGFVLCAFYCICGVVVCLLAAVSLCFVVASLCMLCLRFVLFLLMCAVLLFDAF